MVHEDLLPNVKKVFNDDNIKNRVLTHLGSYDKLFWDFVSLSVFLRDIIESKKSLFYPKTAVVFLFPTFINRTVVSYQLLLSTLEHEHCVMCRSSVEILELLIYFIRSPEEEELRWIKRGCGFPEDGMEKEIRAVKAEKLLKDKEKGIINMRTSLNDHVHANYKSFVGVGIGGGVIVPEFINEEIGKLIALILQMIDVLFEILMNNNIVVTDAKEFYKFKKDANCETAIKEKIELSIQNYKVLMKGMCAFYYGLPIEEAEETFIIG